MNELKSNINYNTDMSPEEFKKAGYRFVDWISDYLANLEKYPVLPDCKPGSIKNKISSEPPLNEEDFDKIFDDFENVIIPGITHWNHPMFMAYFNSTASSIGILAEFLSASLNINGMLWKTSPSATELEEKVVDWFRNMVGLQDDYWGIIYDTASISSMHAIAAAREQLSEYNFREKGMSGRNEVPRLRIYISEHAHSSIEKGAVLLGIGLEGIKKIPVDKNFRMITSELEKSIEKDKKNGWKPFFVTATVGTTSTTSIDPVNEIAKICNRENIWLHIDAAYGGVAAILPEMKNILEGADKADSIVINPHKWMFTPIDLSLFYTRKPDVLKSAFSIIPEYLKTTEDSSVTNYMDYGIQLGRRFRSLKLWFIIKYFGVEGIIKRIREHIRLTKLFAEWITRHPAFEIAAPVTMAVVCFRAVPNGVTDEITLNNYNEKLLEKINNTGKLFLSHTKLNGKYVLRISFSGLRTEEKHVKEAINIIDSISNHLSKEFVKI